MEFIQIKKTDSGIIKKIYDIEKKCFDIPWKKKDIESEIKKKNSFSYILKEENNVIGYILSTAIYDEMNINKLCINPHYRQLGFGKKLMKEILHSAEKNEITKIFLEVKKINIIAIKLYTHFGFHINRIRHYGKSEEETAYEMIKILN
jgi:[ribosomal protein S18]-alanine N-acetyltransferase